MVGGDRSGSLGVFLKACMQPPLFAEVFVFEAEARVRSRVIPPGERGHC